MKKFNEFEESTALDYFKKIYDDGGMSTDVYEITLDMDRDHLLSFDEIGDEKKIKMEVLNYLYNDVGGISTDVYDIELEELNRRYGDFFA